LVVDYIGVNPGGWGCRDPQILGLGSREGRGWVVQHYYILLCAGSMFESGDFSSEIE